MDIYLGHSSRIDFEGELYSPLRESSLNEDHNLVFPHEESGLFDSKAFLRDEADVFLAEVSKPSTGLGIELGWANSFGVPIICVLKNGSEPSNALEALDCKKMVYRNKVELVDKLQEELKSL
jgi:hypothetical protein